MIKAFKLIFQDDYHPVNLKSYTEICPVNALHL